MLQASDLKQEGLLKVQVANWSECAIASCNINTRQHVYMHTFGMQHTCTASIACTATYHALHISSNGLSASQGNVGGMVVGGKM